MTTSQITLIEHAAILVTVLAFVISCIVAMTKSLPLISKIPTQLWTILVSAFICGFTYIGYALEIKHIPFDIIQFIAALIVSLPMSYYCMNGYDQTMKILKKVTISPKDVTDTIEGVVNPDNKEETK